MPIHNIKNTINKSDILLINAALKQVSAATYIRLDSVEGKELSNFAMRQYLSGEYNQKQMVDILLMKINKQDRRIRKAERIAG